MSRKNRAAIVGVGYSQTGRGTGLSKEELAIQAAVAAMEDAGMKPSDIDGMSIHPHMGPGPDVNVLSFAHELGITPLHWFSTNDFWVPAFVYPAVDCIVAVESGNCRVAMAVRVLRQIPSLTERPVAPRAMGDSQFSLPYGNAHFGAMYKQRYMSQFGATEEQFGALVVTQREHASLNEDALLRTPLTIEDYLSARFITKPLRLLDCDYPCDSASAVIFTTEDRARDWKKKPAYVESYSLAALHYDFLQMEDYTATAPAYCGADLWTKTDLRPKDVDCAQLYDGFTVITFQWLEGLGFCKRGEAGPWLEAGNGKLGSRLPLNTDGGACNVGRRHGANYCIESVRQLRGECGVRQVPNAKVSVWANAVGPFSGAVLLTAE